MNSALGKIRHQPLAKVSGMKFGLVAQQSNLWCWRSFAFGIEIRLQKLTVDEVGMEF